MREARRLFWEDMPVHSLETMETKTGSIPVASKISFETCSSITIFYWIISRRGVLPESDRVPAYRVAARLLAAELERPTLGEAGEPAKKRPRLESVVPAPAPPPAKLAFKLLPPAPKPVPRRCGCPDSSPQPRSTTTTETVDTEGTTVVAEAAEAREVAAAEDTDAAAAAERTRLSLEKQAKSGIATKGNYRNNFKRVVQNGRNWKSLCSLNMYFKWFYFSCKGNDR
jgi:hypothetical protein